uniref:REST corepressor 3 n=1 Tax=Hydra vulgaris TaxID=6087 RepID=T2M3G8_HYDVU
MVRSSEIDEEKKSDKITKEGTKNEKGMRVGSRYQAEIPELSQDKVVDDESTCLEPLLVWSPHDKINDNKLEEYLTTAKDKYGYSIEQALGMLFWHKYDVDKAKDDLKNFTPLPDEWSMEDRVVFDQSFHSYGKHFPRIKQQLPDKSIGSLVKYYYTWKKNRNKKSLMDKAEKREINMINGLFADDTDGENESSDSEYEPNEKKLKTSKNGEKLSSPTDNKPSPMLSTNCVNCAGVTSQMNSTPRGKMCVPCYDYWRRTGNMRPKDSEDQISLYHGPQHKLKRKPPKGMQLKQEALIEVAQAHGDSHIRPLEVELINLRRQLLTDRQVIQEQEFILSSRVGKCRPPEMNQKLNPRWTNEELLIAVQCVRRYGQDFNAMAEVIGNKNESHCRSFFINYRRRFNLIEILREYEKENNVPRSNDIWDEEDAESIDNNLTHHQDQSHPPPLRRQVDHIQITESLKGPPPLVNNM